jgi:hypothetical protein
MLKRAIYTIPILLTLTLPATAAMHGGGHMGGGLWAVFEEAHRPSAEAFIMKAFAAGVVVSFAAGNGGFAALTNMKPASAPSNIDRLKQKRSG